MSYFSFCLARVRHFELKLTEIVNSNGTHLSSLRSSFGHRIMRSRGVLYDCRFTPSSATSGLTKRHCDRLHCGFGKPEVCVISPIIPHLTTPIFPPPFLASSFFSFIPPSNLEVLSLCLSMPTWIRASHPQDIQD